jgi:F-type H+-transporting ATPase subunit a
MSSAHNPLSQFEIKPLIKILIAGYDVSFTNSSLFLLLAFLVFMVLFVLPMRKARVIPGKMQAVAEIVYEFVNNTLTETAGEKGQKYMPFIFTIFIFILLCNLLGMLPYGFTVTSHIAVTFALAAVIFILINILAFAIHGLKFFSLFLPQGTPLWMAPLMVVMELFIYLIRPATLALRLTANMVAGHVLLKVIAGFSIMLGAMYAFLPIPFVILLVGFEIFVAILQAYVFTILVCVYLNDALNLH